MTTTKKAKAKRRAGVPQAPNAVQPEPQEAKPRGLEALPVGALRAATATHMTYHPERGIVRLNVQQDILVLGLKQRQGRDIDIALDDLGADILGALTDAFNWIAEDAGATPYEPTE